MVRISVLIISKFAHPLDATQTKCGQNVAILRVSVEFCHTKTITSAFGKNCLPVIKYHLL